MNRSKISIDALRLAGDFGSIPLIILLTAISRKYIEKVATNGDGRGVIIIPGFMTSERAMRPLKTFLNNKGFEAEGWGLGTNYGIKKEEDIDATMLKLGAQIDRMANKTGRPVTLIGHSFGGIFARIASRRYPDSIDRVIMVGSPVSVSAEQVNEVNHLLAWAMEKSTKRSLVDQLIDAERLGFWDPVPVPLVAIQSPFDGMLSTDLFAPFKDNEQPLEIIPTISTHCGMCSNPYALLAIADRLMADRDNWTLFNPSSYDLGIFQKGYLQKPVIEKLSDPDERDMWQSETTDIYPLQETNL